MRVLSIISQKGGSGRSTLATALAVAAEAGGKTCAIFDLDPQASATFWRDVRQAPTPAVTAIPASRLPHLLTAAQESGCDLAIVDVPPFAKDIAFSAAQHADFVLIPTRPAIFDLESVRTTLELVNHYDKPSAVVLTCCPPAGRELHDAAQAIKELGATLCPVQIGYRIAFSRAQQRGLVAQEFEPQGKAAQEIEKLYTYICIQVGFKRGRRQEKT